MDRDALHAAYQAGRGPFDAEDWRLEVFLFVAVAIVAFFALPLAPFIAILALAIIGQSARFAYYYRRARRGTL